MTLGFDCINLFNCKGKYSPIQNIKLTLWEDFLYFALSIVAFESDGDREAYSSAWKAVTGFHKGKSCQLGGVQTNIGNRPMRHVSYAGGNGNHKGKAD